MKTEMLSEKNFTTLFKLFWIYVICGVAGYFIETVWCWIDFQEFSSRTSNLFFPISCVWGLGGVLLYLLTQRNRWQQNFYIFIKCTVIGTVFEFLCGYLGECLFQVTFWDYSGMPLHIGKYINVPFCLIWGLLGAVWVRKIYPVINPKLEKLSKNSFRFMPQMFLSFMICTQVVTGAALLRMHGRQEGRKSSNQIEAVLDYCFTDETLQGVFPKMKSTVTGESVKKGCFLPKKRLVYIPCCCHSKSCSFPLVRIFPRRTRH